MSNKIQLLEEAYNRGLLPPEKAIAFEEYKKRLADVEYQKSVAKDFPPYDPTTGEYIPQPKEKEPERFLGEQLYGAGETALTLGTGATSGAVGGIVGAGLGLYDAVSSGQYGTKEGAEKVLKGFEGGAAAGTYTPRTEIGQEYTSDVAGLLEGSEAIAPFTTGLRMPLTPAIKSKALEIRDEVAPNLRFHSRETPAPVNPELTPKQQSQLFLESQGGTLSAYQTGQAGSIRTFMEKIGDLGIFSKGISGNRRAKNAEIISKEIQKMVNGDDTSLIQTSQDLGGDVARLIQEGKKTANDLYGTDLEQIKNLAGDATLDTKGLIQTLEKFKAENKTEAGSTLDKATEAVISDTIARLKGKPATQLNKSALSSFTRESKQQQEVTPAYSNKLPIIDLLEEEKLFSRKVSSAGNFGAEGFNPSASRELSELSSRLRDTLSNELKGQGYNNVANAYSEAKNTYSSLLSSLEPDDISGIVKKGLKDENFESIGNLLLSASSESKISKLMSSIDTAFETARKAGTLPDGVKTASDLKKSIRQSYLDKVFGDITSEPDTLFKGSFPKMYDNLSSKNKSKPLKLILREDYSNYKKLLRALKDASESQKSDPLSLALRSRELSSVSNLATGALIATGGTAGLVAGLGVLVTPAVLSRLATNPKAIDRLLKLNSMKLTNPELIPKQVGIISEQIINSYESKKEREEMRQLLQSK